MPAYVKLTGRINNIINMHDTVSAGTLLNFGYLTVLTIIKDTITASICVRYALYSPLKYNVERINAIPGIGKPMKSFVLIFSAITLYLVNLKTPQITINKLMISVIG